MGGRTGRFVSDRAKDSYAKKRSTFNQQLSAYNSRVKFGKSDTREGGLSSAEVGSRPTMSFSSGFVGAYERRMFAGDSGSAGFGGIDDYQRNKRQQIFGGTNSQLG
jgi:hypothetical protein